MVLPEQMRELDFLFGAVEKILILMREYNYLGVFYDLDVILGFLDDDFKNEKGFFKLEKRLKKYLCDVSFMREVSLIQSVKEEQESRIEYFGVDIGLDERLLFNKKVEAELNNFFIEVRKFLSETLKAKRVIDYG